MIISALLLVNPLEALQLQGNDIVPLQLHKANVYSKAISFSKLEGLTVYVD